MSKDRPSAVVAYMARKREEIINGVIRDVAELPYIPRTDDDQVMQVTADELRAILLTRLSLAPNSR